MMKMSLNRAMLLALILFVSCGRAILSSPQGDTISSEPDRESSILETVDAIKARAAARNSTYKIASLEELESMVVSNLEDEELTLRNLSGLVEEVMSRTPDELAHMLPASLVKILGARNIDPGLVLRALTLNLGKHSDYFISEAFNSVVAMVVNNRMPVELARQIQQAFDYSVNNQTHAFGGVARELSRYISSFESDRSLPVVIAIIPAWPRNDTIPKQRIVDGELNGLIDSIESCTFDPSQVVDSDDGGGVMPARTVVCSVNYSDGIAIWMTTP